MAIRENATVKIVSGLHEGKTGKVSRVYPDLDVAIVAVEDPDYSVAKVHLSELEEIESQDKEVNPEIPEGAKYITKTDFISAIAHVARPGKLIEEIGADKATAVGLGVIMGGVKLTEKLFKDADIILIAKDQLIHEIAISALDEDPKFMVVALMNSIILRDIVDILFSGEND